MATLFRFSSFDYFYKYPKFTNCNASKCGDWEYVSWGLCPVCRDRLKCLLTKRCRDSAALLCTAILQCSLLSSTCFMFQAISAPSDSAAPEHPPNCSPGGEHWHGTHMQLDPVFCIYCWLPQDYYTTGFGKEAKRGKLGNQS